MERQRTFPRLGAVLAVITILALVASGMAWPVAGTVLLVWLSTLWLGTARAPDIERREKPSPFSHSNMRAILELSASPLILTERGTVVIANGAARALVGEHIVGQDVRIAFRNPDAIELLNREADGTCIVRNLLRPQDSWQMRRQIINDRLAIIELADRSAEAVVSRAHTDFVANASHELRTPLAAIIGYVETLREGQEDMPLEVTNRFLAIIEREAERMQALVSDLMSLSRIEAEKHDAPSTPLFLSDLVLQAACDAAGSERQERLNFAITKGLIVAGDPPQLEQVVRNLVDNAFKYGGEDTPVRVEVVTAPGNFAQITVADEGVGIAKEHLPYLTRRFYRTDPGRSRMSGGTGLGLAIVKHVVERHRGRLDIDSVVGQGTRVRVRLPIHGLNDGAADERSGEDALIAERPQ